MIGFIFLVFGTLLFNEIFILPFWGFDANTKDKIEARDAAEKRDMYYMSFSPNASYDGNRNKRLLAKMQDVNYKDMADYFEEFNMKATDNQ